MNDFLNIFLLSFIGSIAGLIGGVTFLYHQKLSKKLEINAIPFAAGILLTVSLLGLLPESLEFAGEKSFTIVLITFFAAYLFENFIFEIHHHDAEEIVHDHKHKSSIPFVIVGDTIHNFIDGVAIAAAYLVNPGLGLATAISSFLHEVPHEIGDFGILLKAGWKKKNILLINLISATATIIGALLILYYSPSNSILGTLLAISAGLFLYLGASDFLPHIKEEIENPWEAVLPLLIGVVVMVLTFTLIPHTHEHNQENQPQEFSQAQ